MTIERVIKERARPFLVRNKDDGDGWLFDIYKGPIYRLYDDHGELWMTVAVRRSPIHGIVVTDVASGLMVPSDTFAKTYDDAVRNVIGQWESIDKARALDYYKHSVYLCQKEYDELRERGVLK